MCQKKTHGEVHGDSFRKQWNCSQGKHNGNIGNCEGDAKTTERHGKNRKTRRRKEKPRKVEESNEKFGGNILIMN